MWLDLTTPNLSPVEELEAAQAELDSTTSTLVQDEFLERSTRWWRSAKASPQVERPATVTVRYIWCLYIVDLLIHCRWLTRTYGPWVDYPVCFSKADTSEKVPESASVHGKSFRYPGRGREAPRGRGGVRGRGSRPPAL